MLAQVAGRESGMLLRGADDITAWLCAASAFLALAHPQRFRLMFGGQLRIARHAALREVATKTFEGLSGALAARVGEAPGARDASIAAWALVHGLAQLLLGDRIAPAARQGRSEDQFIRDVLGTTRFAAGAASPVPASTPQSA